MGGQLSHPGINPLKHRRDSIDDLNARIEKEIHKREDYAASVPQTVKHKDKEVNDMFERQVKLQRELSDVKGKHKTAKEERREVQKRLNQIMGSQSEDTNKSDIGDINKTISGKFKALYENEWRRAFVSLKTKESDSHCVSILLNALKDVYKECKSLANDGFFQQVGRCIESPYESRDESNKPEVMPDLLKQQIVEFRKVRAVNNVEKIQKVLVPAIKITNADSNDIHEYVSRCVEVCWLMVVQDPPLAFEFRSDHLFDRNMFNEYTEHGKYVDDIVWPALLQHTEVPC